MMLICACVFVAFVVLLPQPRPAPAYVEPEVTHVMSVSELDTMPQWLLDAEAENDQRTPTTIPAPRLPHIDEYAELYPPSRVGGVWQ